MKKITRSILFLTVVTVLVAVPIVVFAGHDSVATATVNLHPSNQSGVQGKIDFTDDGSTLTIHGTATGLTPGVFYASLIYDNKSVPGGPGTPEQAHNPSFLGNCEPAIFDPTDPDNILETMLIGFWDVDEGGNGTLWAENIFVEFGPDKEYVPLDKFRTVSIRFPEPGADQVQACGWVPTHPAG